MLYSLEELNPLLEGRIVFINDNANSSKEWHEIELTLNGRLLNLLPLLWQHDPSILWLKREDWPSITDAFARLMTFGVRNQKINVSASLESKQNVDVAASSVARNDILLQFRTSYETTSEIYLNVQLSELYQALVYYIVSNNKNLDTLKKIFTLDRNQILWYDDKIVVPANLRPTWLWSAHTPGGVHVGRDRTRINLSLYLWPPKIATSYQLLHEVGQDRYLIRVMVWSGARASDIDLATYLYR
jgi:hypothetical protein